MAEEINVQIIEAEPIQVTVVEGDTAILANIFTPPEGGKRIVGLYVKDGKVWVDYED